MTPDARRRLPQVDRIVRSLEPELDGIPRPLLVDAVRAVVADARRRREALSEPEVVARVRERAEVQARRSLRPVINATGVVLHTNLGRAPLSTEALDAVVAVAQGYSNLEWDAATGRRGDRFGHVEPLLAIAAGAEAALVVNNNAAAVLLVCAALASGREVVVSRGELIEIGGGFRIPEVLETSGAILREVGTTNRTRVRDYERAIGSETAALLKVHPSNYRVVGFTNAASLDELATLATRRRVPLVYDVGSGLLRGELADEPTIVGALAGGADLVCFSGDKLFGGPQAGIVVGKRKLVDRLRRHPLLRAIRPDKMQLAALGATALAYLRGADGDVPARAMLARAGAGIARRAGRLARALVELGYEADTVAGESVAGGGSLPGHTVETTLVRLKDPRRTAGALAAALRENEPPIVARVAGGHVILDLRTVMRGQDVLIERALGPRD